MNLAQTMVFVDLAGSTSTFEALDNAQVADVVTKVTQWIHRVVQAHEGRTVKFLGDGVLAQLRMAARPSRPWSFSSKTTLSGFASGQSLCAWD